MLNKQVVRGKEKYISSERPAQENAVALPGPVQTIGVSERGCSQ